MNQASSFLSLLTTPCKQTFHKTALKTSLSSNFYTLKEHKRNFSFWMMENLDMVRWTIENIFIHEESSLFSEFRLYGINYELNREFIRKMIYFLHDKKKHTSSINIKFNNMNYSIMRFTITFSLDHFSGLILLSWKSKLCFFLWEERKVFILDNINHVSLFDQNRIIVKEFLNSRGSEALGFGESKTSEEKTNKNSQAHWLRKC